MKTLKDHQATMVYLLSQETAIPTSAIRLAHALHDVLAHMNNTNVAPVAHTERRIDATTPGLNDAMLAQDIAAVKPKQQSLESMLKQRDNTIRQLKGRVADLVAESSAYQSKVVELQDLLADARGGVEPEQAGCRKQDTEVADEGWIEWCGGDCPVAAGVRTTVKFRCGETATDEFPEDWNWERFNGENTIVAYRAVKP